MTPDQFNSNAQFVHIEERDGFSIVRLIRATKRNAVNRAMRVELLEVFEVIRDRYSVCILTGEENSFCAGVDLKEYNEDVEKGIAFDPQTDWARVILAFRDHPCIFIAAVNGFALGGGITLINACDLAVAAKDAPLGLPEMGFATYPTLAGPSTQFTLPRKIAAWLILTANRFDGTTAERWGLVNAAVEAEDLMSVAASWAERISKFDSIALAESKKALDAIPLTITNWKQAFDFAEGVNARIEQLSRASAIGANKIRVGKSSATQGSSPK